MRGARLLNIWTVGEYEFTEHVDTRGAHLFGFTINGKERHEYYYSLDKALIAAVGEKYTGPRGAGGSGVGTAADWFARMIGLEGAE